MNEIVRDTWKSKKLWYSVFATMMVVVAGVAAAIWASLAPVYDTLVGGVVAIAGLYLTGNVAQKWVGSKVPPTTQLITKAQPLVDADDEKESPAKPPAPRFTEEE